MKKLKIPDNFTATTETGYLHYDFGKTTLLVARTRAGKTSLTLEVATLIKSNKPKAICIMFGPDLKAYPEDLLDKNEYYDSIQQLSGDIAVWSNSNHKEEFMAQLTGFSVSPNSVVLCTNSNHTHVNRILAYLKQASSSVPVFAVIDEAHKEGELSYNRLKRELRKMKNVAVIETTASYRDLLLDSNPPDFIQAIVPRGEYVDPLEATLIPFDHVSWTRDNFALHEEQIAAIKQQIQNKQSLTLINGYELVQHHDAFKTQIKRCINNPEVVILTMNSGSVTWTRAAEDYHIEHTVSRDNGKKIRAASSAVSAMYHKEGFRHIIVVGQKQVSEGQTVGCSDLSLTLQIVGTAKGDSNAATLIQTIRTGGLNILYPQAIMMDPQKWESAKLYVSQTEQLAKILAGVKTPEEYQQAVDMSYAEALEARRSEYRRLAASGFLEVKGLKVTHGDYKVVRAPAIPEGVGSHYFEIPLKNFGPAFEYGHKGSSGELYAYVREAARSQPWFNNHSTLAKRVQGTPTDKLRGRGNDVQVIINADPQSQEAQERPLVFWKRDNVIAVRYLFRFTPCLTHNYYGELQNFSHTAGRVLDIVT